MAKNKVPKEVEATFEQISAQIHSVCLEHLNAEYSEISIKLALKLARKRPSPLLAGKTASWACGIVYTIGAINFLHDKSQTPHMKLEDLGALFGVSKSTGGNKSTEIRRLFKLRQFDPEYTLPSMIERNPMAWLISVNGFLVDARHVPREVQAIAYAQGLIPYIPESHQEFD